MSFINPIQGFIPNSQFLYTTTNVSSDNISCINLSATNASLTNLTTTTFSPANVNTGNITATSASIGIINSSSLNSSIINTSQTTSNVIFGTNASINTINSSIINASTINASTGVLSVMNSLTSNISHLNVSNISGNNLSITNKINCSQLLCSNDITALAVAAFNISVLSSNPLAYSTGDITKTNQNVTFNTGTLSTGATDTLFFKRGSEISKMNYNGSLNASLINSSILITQDITTDTITANIIDAPEINATYEMTAYLLTVGIGATIPTINSSTINSSIGNIKTINSSTINSSIGNIKTINSSLINCSDGNIKYVTSDNMTANFDIEAFGTVISRGTEILDSLGGSSTISRTSTALEFFGSGLITTANMSLSTAVSRVHITNLSNTNLSCTTGSFTTVRSTNGSFTTNNTSTSNNSTCNGLTFNTSKLNASNISIGNVSITGTLTSPLTNVSTSNNSTCNAVTLNGGKLNASNISITENVSVAGMLSATVIFGNIQANLAAGTGINLSTIGGITTISNTGGITSPLSVSVINASNMNASNISTNFISSFNASLGGSSIINLSVGSVKINEFTTLEKTSIYRYLNQLYFEGRGPVTEPPIDYLFFTGQSLGTPQMKITALTGTTEVLSLNCAGTANISTINASTGNISNLSSINLSCQTITATDGTIATINSTDGNFLTTNISTENVSKINCSNMSVVNASFTGLMTFPLYIEQTFGRESIAYVMSSVASVPIGSGNICVAVFDSTHFSNTDLMTFNPTTIGSTAAGTGFICVKAGVYKIDYTVCIRNTGYTDRSCERATIYVNGVTQTRGRSFGYCRRFDYVNLASCTSSTYLTLTAGNYVQIHILHSIGASTIFVGSYTGFEYANGSTIAFTYYGA